MEENCRREEIQKPANKLIKLKQPMLMWQIFETHLTFPPAVHWCRKGLRIPVMPTSQIKRTTHLHHPSEQPDLDWLLPLLFLGELAPVGVPVGSWEAGGWEAVLAQWGGGRQGGHGVGAGADAVGTVVRVLVQQGHAIHSGGAVRPFHCKQKV